MMRSEKLVMCGKYCVWGVHAKIWCCAVQSGNAWKNIGVWVCALKFGVAGVH
jgi:hypothetical protein